MDLKTFHIIAKITMVWFFMTIWFGGMAYFLMLWFGYNPENSRWMFHFVALVFLAIIPEAVEADINMAEEE